MNRAFGGALAACGALIAVVAWWGRPCLTCHGSGRIRIINNLEVVGINPTLKGFELGYRITDAHTDTCPYCKGRGRGR